MRSSASLKWYQFRLRSLLTAVLIVQLACIVSPHLMESYRRYESAAQIDKFMALARLRALETRPRVSQLTFECVERPIAPLLRPSEDADVALPTGPVPWNPSLAAFAEPPDLTTAPR